MAVIVDDRQIGCVAVVKFASGFAPEQEIFVDEFGVHGEWNSFIA